MFQTLICPSSGACDYDGGLPHRLSYSVMTDVLAISVQSQTHIQSTSKIGTKYQITNEKYHTQTNTMNTKA